MTAPSVLWLRQDLRLADQEALAAAAAAGPVVPVYVLDDETPGAWRIGGAQRWWLNHSLAALDKALRAKGSRLILRRGRAAEEVARISNEVGAAKVHALAHHEPWWRAAEDALGERVTLRLYPGRTLAPLEEVTTGEGGQFKVFAAFWRALQTKMPPPKPQPAPKRIDAPSAWPKSDDLADWGLLPRRDWAAGFAEWTPGEAAAAGHLARFADVVRDYPVARNLPSQEGTSRLSPYLHHGEISPAQVWHAFPHAPEFLRELAWRDFTQGLVRVLPDYGEEAGRTRYRDFPWRTGPDVDRDFTAWTRGMTGYPIVDAGMRQLWISGWMHNRVRMITASFVIKHLLIDWRRGERWFWDTLLCADYGNNSVNWQWTSGTGVDSNPFGRIMAPLSQSAKFDAAGYIRRWVPELAALGDEAIHDPDEAGCRPPEYPAKLIGHREGRARALAAATGV